MNKLKWHEPFHSPEEAYVSWYLDELTEAGFVIKHEHQPSSIHLSPKVSYNWEKTMKTKNKKMNSALLQEHIYTPDFKVTWADGAHSVFFKDVNSVKNHNDCYFWAETCLLELAWNSYLEIKPSFDRNNMTRLFSINQKWIYDKLGLYVQKIVPVKLFMETFTPQRYLKTDQGRHGRSIHYYPRTLKEFLNKQS